MIDNLMNKIALTVVTRDGKAGIRQLRAAAVMAHRTGYPDAADAILEIVEAAEAALAKDCLMRLTQLSSMPPIGRNWVRTR